MDKSSGGWKTTGVRQKEEGVNTSTARTEEKEENDDNLRQIEECARNEEFAGRVEDYTRRKAVKAGSWNHYKKAQNKCLQRLMQLRVRLNRLDWRVENC
jgi:hypothetical protein